MAKSLSALPVGSVVKSANTKYNGQAIRWIVGTQDTSQGRTGLVTERMITLKCFDAKEPSNSNSDRRSYGNNRYSVSNIDKWLNSAAASWYAAQHGADAPPTAANCWSNHNPYDTEAGFLANFEADFRNAILDSTIRVAKNTVTDGGGYEDIVRQVFLLSNTNVGLSNENGVAEGSLWSYFNSASRRQCYPTAEAVSKSTYTNSSLSASQYWWWWLRTPYAGLAHYARRVYTDGSLGDSGAYGGSDGVRPALYLASSNLVSDTTDTDGAYILLWNQPPTTPSSITYGTPQAGQKLTLSTGGSTDPEGDAISYVWERKVDSGVWTQIGITTAKTIQDTVPSSGTTYYARVKAVDAVGNESAYCTGSGKTISYNTPPVISGSDQNMGAKTDPFTYKYTVTDAQSATQTLTVTETLTNGTETITLRTYTATAGAQNTADLSSVWIRLIAGTHVLKVTASDGNGGTAVRNITFSRTVTRIAAARAFNTDAKVTKVFVSLYPSDRPAGSTLHLEVTNNPFDTNPVWEDITEKANRLVHTFANSTVANGYGLGYRFYLLKGTEEIEITQATIRFA